VDSQLQHAIPSLLEATLALEWANRWDWFFGINLGIFYDAKRRAVVPTGFLSVGVKRFSHEDLRSSYVLLAENQAPHLVLEVVSKQNGTEYRRNRGMYAFMGVLYYVVYHPGSRRKSPLEVYRLVNDKYEYALLSGNPIWLPEIGLGIGRDRGTYQGITREWLYWYTEQGQRLLTPEECIEQEQQRRLAAVKQVETLAKKLRSLGINPESIA